MNKKGFTLIELLVVIAIIGVLASVVLASLNTARSKGADAAIKANLANVRSQAEIFYDGNSNVYTGLCANANVVSAINAAKSAAGIATATGVNATGAAGTATCQATTDKWAIESPMKSTSTSFMCVDSTGAATTTVASTLTTASDYVCG